MKKIELYNLSPEDLSKLIQSNIKPELERIIAEHIKGGLHKKEFISRKETADFFEVSLVCIHDWVKKGIIKPYKMGNRTYFKYSELIETLLNSNRDEKK